MSRPCPGPVPASELLASGVVDVAGDCPIHGHWSLTLPAGMASDVACPECARAAREKKRREERRLEQARLRTKALESLQQQARIPSRYAGRGFGHFRADAEPQQRVLRACMKYADRFPEARRRGASLVLHGRVGTGKTHLACAIVQHVIQQHLVSAQFWRVFEVITSIREAYRTRDVSLLQSVRRFVAPELLVIDDVGAQHGSQDEALLLNELLSQRHDELHPTIILSNEDLDGLGRYLGPRVLDRLNEDGGSVLAFDWESYRSRVIHDEDLPRPDVSRPPYAAPE